MQEHVGTRTAVQIRSHAQKFFSKLEKEALTEGIPLGHSHDLEIPPPPRRKRKSSRAYPRKVDVGSLSPFEEAKDEKVSNSAASSERPVAVEIQQRTKQTSGGGSCSEVFNLLHVPSAASVYSANKGSSNICTFHHYVKEVKDKTVQSESSKAVKGNHEEKKKEADHTDVDMGRLGSIYLKRGEMHQSRLKNSAHHWKIINKVLNPPQKHIPGKFIDRNSAKCKQTTCSSEFIPVPVTNKVEAHTNVNPFSNPVTLSGHESHSNCTMSSAHQPFLGFPDVTQFCSNQDAYRSFLSSDSSSLVFSTLLQNPAIHAVASLAASFGPSVNANAPIDSTTENLGGSMSKKQSSPSPSMAAIAAATVAAASAWWATNGLLPMFPPFHPSYAFAPPSTGQIPTMDIAQASEDNKEKKDDRPQNLGQEDNSKSWIQDSGAPRTTQKSSKSLSSSESELDESRRGERSQYTELKSSAANKFEPLSDTGFHGSDKAQHNKNSKRASYCSNTPSSGEEEIETILKKHKEVNDEAEQLHLENHPVGEARNHRLSSSRVTNGSSKVSGEVVISDGPAFALSATELLPQRFLSLQTNDDEMPKLCKDKEVTALPVDLSGKAGESSNKLNIDSEDNLVSEGECGRLKASRRAFKPYGRCSTEAKDNQATTDGEKGDKRIRMEG